MHSQGVTVTAGVNVDALAPFFVISQPCDAVSICLDRVSQEQVEKLRAAMQQPGRLFVCSAPPLPVVIERLSTEHAALAAELNTMEPDALMNVRGRTLANREQELHTTLAVLRGLGQQPLQIEEPAL